MHSATLNCVVSIIDRTPKKKPRPRRDGAPPTFTHTELHGASSPFFQQKQQQKVLTDDDLSSFEVCISTS